ncbi:MAG: hypothetical protein ABI459_00895 [Deltaproteobacteria bacterium]
MSQTNPDQSPLVDSSTTSDIVVTAAPGFATASLMISSAQAQARALEASVAQTSHFYMAGLATATQCVGRILGDPGDQLQALKAILAANGEI